MQQQMQQQQMQQQQMQQQQHQQQIQQTQQHHQEGKHEQQIHGGGGQNPNMHPQGGHMQQHGGPHVQNMGYPQNLQHQGQMGAFGQPQMGGMMPPHGMQGVPQQQGVQHMQMM